MGRPGRHRQKKTEVLKYLSTVLYLQPETNIAYRGYLQVSTVLSTLLIDAELHYYSNASTSTHFTTAHMHVRVGVTHICNIHQLDSETTTLHFLKAT